MFSLPTEDAYDGSGSGSGDDDDDDDDPNGGSGLGAIDYPARIPDHTTGTSSTGGSSTGGSAGTTTTHHHGVSHGTHGSGTHGTGTGAGGVPSSTDAYDEHDNEVDPDARKKDSAAGAASRIGGLSLRQALLTYMFPIYVAWFGGVLCDLF